MDPSHSEYYVVPDKRDFGYQSGRSLLLGYEAETGRPQILQVGPPRGNARPSSPSQFISISPLEYNKAQHDRICDVVWPRFGKKNKANVWRAQLGSVETKMVTTAYEHQRKSNDWKLFSVRPKWNRARWVSVVWTHWKQDSTRLLDLTLTEFEIKHLEDRSKPNGFEPLQTTRYIVKEYRSLQPSRPRPSGNSPVAVTEEIVSKDIIGEKITAYIQARSSETSSLVLFLYDVFWAKNCFPKGTFPTVEEGINSLLYDPPKRYDLGAQSAGGSGWHQPVPSRDSEANRSRDPRRPSPSTSQDQKTRRGPGKVYLLDLKPAIESVSIYRDSKRDLYSAARKFGIQTSEEEKNPVDDSLLIVRLWCSVFSGSPKKIREEELESARKSASVKPEFENVPKGGDVKNVPPVRPDDEDVDPNDVLPGPSNVTSGPATIGKPQVAPEVDWENAFDDEEEDDY